jgi:RecB family exonuclease
MPSRSSEQSTRRKRNLYDPASGEPFKLSRTKIELFLDCPRCFYLDRRLGIARPTGPAFTLNSAVDFLLKKEFDHYRERRQPHPLMTASSIDMIPYQHPDLSTWRENFKGVQHHDPVTNFLITGAVDDVWVDLEGTLGVVDYKSTSTEKTISLDDEWKQAYKRQMEVYQWLLRRSGFLVSNTGYFVYANASKNRDNFDARLEFGMQIIVHVGSDAWVEPAISEAYRCLQNPTPPPCSEGCEWCGYRLATL